jgi:hypothetical protein
MQETVLEAFQLMAVKNGSSFLRAGNHGRRIEEEHQGIEGRDKKDAMSVNILTAQVMTPLSYARCDCDRWQSGR